MQPLIIYIEKTATFTPENGVNVELKSANKISKRLARAFNNLPTGNYHVEFYGSFATICTMLGSETCILKDIRIKNKGKNHGNN